MRAVRWHGRRDVRVDVVPDPTGPGPDEVILDIGWCGICGTDLEEYQDGPIWVPVGEPNSLTGQMAPLTMGHEFAGTIVATGKDVRGLRVGDIVAADVVLYCGHCYWCQRHQVNLCTSMGALGLHGDGGLAEFCRVPASMCIRAPEGVSAESAALAEPLSVVVRAMRRGRLVLGESVAIVGAGAVGLLAAQAARVGGASEVFVVEPEAIRRDLATSLGASATIDPRQTDPVEELRRLTGGIGPDLVVECAGARGTAALAISLARRGGRIVIVGLNSQPAEFRITDEIVGPEREIIGSLAHVYDEDFAAAVRLLGDGRVRGEPVVSHRIGFADVISGGFERLERSKADVTKILVSPRL
jgi:(R,R)-butanediol dehydrogenase / meso-butanediol dehydrogenase / diacetyl reductase